MQKKTAAALALIAALLVLNAAKYIPRASSHSAEAQTASAEMPDLEVPSLNSFEFTQTRVRAAQRDVFAFQKPSAPAPPPKPAEQNERKSVPEGPDPKEVALEAARIDMLNIHIHGILSSKSGLSAMVSSPFYEGPAIAGTNLGKGIFISAVGKNSVKISHPDLNLIREILVE